MADPLIVLRNTVDRLSDEATARYINWHSGGEEIASPEYLEGYADALEMVVSIIDAHLELQPTELEKRIDEYSLDEEW